MSIKAQPSFSLKDQLFNTRTVGVLSAALQKADRGFRRKAFERQVLDAFAELELKQRIAWIVTSLEPHLPADIGAAIDVLQRALPAPLDPSRTDDDFGEFIWVVPGEYVAKHGCSSTHLDRSLSFLREATKRFSSENAIRPFLSAYPDEAMKFVHECADDNNYHVRRLASEGIRPFLPWAPRVDLPVDAVIDVLERLHGDRTRYVTRSVANTLNDISKLDGDLVIATLERWRRKKRQDGSELDWMTRHALRTLVKEEHKAALELLGYPTKPRFRLSDLQTTARVKVGGNFAWQCVVTSLADQQLKIALKIHFLKANGGHSAKVFAVKDVRLGKGERLQIDKRQAFKPITTRVLYPGTHYAELVVNGVSRGKRAFELAT
jgi:3-methyladenine DNA glycosylase AlkC